MNLRSFDLFIIIFLFLRFSFVLLLRPNHDYFKVKFKNIAMQMST